MLIEQILRLYNDTGSILLFCFKDVYIFKDGILGAKKYRENPTTLEGVQSPPSQELRYRKNIAIVSQECRGNIQVIHPCECNNI